MKIQIPFALIPLVALGAIAANGVPVRAATPSQPNNSAPPNVVLILSDDQGFTDYGFMGHPVVKTPNLDRLAAQSLLYTRGYVIRKKAS